MSRSNARAVVRTIGPPGARPQQPHEIVQLGCRRDGRARIARLIFLPDGDRRRDAENLVHIRLLHALEKLPRIGGKRFDVAPLSFRIDRVEDERRFARTRNARHHRQLIVRNIDIDVLRVVNARAAYRKHRSMRHFSDGGKLEFSGKAREGLLHQYRMRTFHRIRQLRSSGADLLTWFRAAQARSAVAPHARPVRHLAFGNHAAADAGGGGDSVLRAFSDAFPGPSSAGRCARSVSCWRSGPGLAITIARAICRRPRESMSRAGAFPYGISRICALFPGSATIRLRRSQALPSICRMPCVDGNVFRVLSRVFGDATDIASVPGAKHFSQLADDLLDRKSPGDFNQAMMELGATVCLPKNPQCLLCPVSSLCRRARTGTQTQFPVKLSKQKSVEESRTVSGLSATRVSLPGSVRRTPRSCRASGNCRNRSNLLSASAIRNRSAASAHGITFHNYSFAVVEAAPLLI